MAQRKHLTKTIEYWFNQARENQKQGKMSDALLCMEQCYNHAENAAFHFIRKYPECLTEHKRVTGEDLKLE